jgi:hypothetical protein
MTQTDRQTDRHVTSVTQRHGHSTKIMFAEGKSTRHMVALWQQSTIFHPAETCYGA